MNSDTLITFYDSNDEVLSSIHIQGEAKPSDYLAKIHKEFKDHLKKAPINQNPYAYGWELLSTKVTGSLIVSEKSPICLVDHTFFPKHSVMYEIRLKVLDFNFFSQQSAIGSSIRLILCHGGSDTHIFDGLLSDYEGEDN